MSPVTATAEASETPANPAARDSRATEISAQIHARALEILAVDPELASDAACREALVDAWLEFEASTYLEGRDE